MNIRPDLLARLYAIHAYFFSLWRQVPLYRPTFNAQQAQPHAPIPFHLEDDGDDSGEGGGGTITGLRVERPQESRMKI